MAKPSGTAVCNSANMQITDAVRPFPLSVSAPGTALEGITVRPTRAAVMKRGYSGWLDARSNLTRRVFHTRQPRRS